MYLYFWSICDFGNLSSRKATDAPKERTPISVPHTSPEIISKAEKALSDLLPIILVITVFQLAILRQTFPDLLEVLIGAVLVIIGLMLFVHQNTEHKLMLPRR